MWWNLLNFVVQRVFLQCLTKMLLLPLYKNFFVLYQFGVTIVVNIYKVPVAAVTDGG